MSDKAIEAIAGYLAEVDLDPVEWWHRPARGILAALKAAGIAVVELPEAERPEPEDGEHPDSVAQLLWDCTEFVITRWRQDGNDTVQVALQGEPLEPLSVAEARALAAALLAAANAAEAVGA